MAFFLVDKPKQLTSFDIVRIFRKKLGTRRVGHTGTLDPLATWLLLIATDMSTKLIEYCMGHDKTYEAQIRIDGISVTGDMEWPITELDPWSYTIPTREQIEAKVKKNFTWAIEQVPPAYSAIKIDGKAAYDRARSGESVQIEPREVSIYGFDILDYIFPYIDVRLRVSAGTYIRSIAHDLGKALTGGGYLASLRRTQIADLTLSHLSLISDLEDSSSWTPIPHQEVVPDIPELLSLSSEVLHDLSLGKKTVQVQNTPAWKYFIRYEDGSMWVVQVDDDESVKVLKNNI